jgi:transposase
MALGKQRKSQQEGFWIERTSLARPSSHPFYERLNQILEENRFDEFSEQQCRKFYAEGKGRPGLVPGTYFRLLLIGYFEGIDSERGISWRVSDSLSLRSFLAIGLDEATPDHSTISRTRRLIDVDTHQSIFNWVLEIVAHRGLLKGNVTGVDATTLEANAALRSIVHRKTGESYDEFLKKLAQASGIQTPTKEQLARFDRKRKKKGTNQDWMNPFDPDARITKMKAGGTHLAHKAEHAVDLETGAILAVTIQQADVGDTTTMVETLAKAGETLAEVASKVNSKLVGELVDPIGPKAVIADKGYHSNDALIRLKQVNVRAYIAEPDRGRRRWKGKQEAQKAVYANRRRITGSYGKSLLRRRGEFVERSFAHVYETGGMRRTHLRGSENILKRVLLHVGAFNLGLVLRQLTGKGTPRGFQGSKQDLIAASSAIRFWCMDFVAIVTASFGQQSCQAE